MTYKALLEESSPHSHLTPLQHAPQASRAGIHAHHSSQPLFMLFLISGTLSLLSALLWFYQPGLSFKEENTVLLVQKKEICYRV